MRKVKIFEAAVSDSILSSAERVNRFVQNNNINVVELQHEQTPDGVVYILYYDTK